MSIYLGTVKMSGSAGIAGGDASVIASDIVLSTTAQPYIRVNNSSKNISLPETDPYDTARTPTSHTHGQITNDGKITSTSVSLASGDSLVFVDYSDSSKIKKTSITFDGSTTTKYLSQAGTWVSVPSQTTVSYTPTVTSSTTGAYVIGTLTINGSDTTIYGKDTTSSGGGGASYLDDLNDVSTTGASIGQALVYNGSSWAPGTVSGGGSWSPTQLSSGFRIWNLSTGIYQMPASGTFYYSGTSGSATLACTGGMLYVYEENSVKQWYIMTDYSSGSNTYGSEVLISGYTTSTGGTHSFHYFQSTNEGDKYLGFTYYNSIISDLNSYNVRLYQPGMCSSTLSSSATGKPANLTLNANTRFVMFTSKDYNNGVHSTPTQYLRQDLYLPSIGKHYYRYCSLINSTPTVLTTTPNCDANGWVEEISIPSYTSSDAGKCLQVATGGSSLQWSTVSGGGGASYDFNDTSLVYSSTYSDQGLSAYYADCTSSKRNVMFLNIDSSTYTSYFSHDESLGIYLKTANLTENYIFIYNSSGYDITADYEIWDFITSSDVTEYVSHLNQTDSSGSYIKIPNNRTTMIGISRMQMNNEVFMVITYGGTFSYT